MVLLVKFIRKKKYLQEVFAFPCHHTLYQNLFFFQTLFSWSLGKNISIKYLRLPHVFGEGELKSRLWPQIKTNKINHIKLDNPKFMTNFININKLIKKK